MSQTIYHPERNPQWWRSDVRLRQTWRERQRDERRLGSKKLSKNRARNVKSARTGISPSLVEAVQPRNPDSLGGSG